MRVGESILLVVWICTVCTTYGYSQHKVLKSGEPIKIGTLDSIGPLSLKSIASFNMGMAKVDNDPYPDLFLMSDHWNPGTYLYYFRGFTKSNEPVFSEPVKISLPFKDDGKRKLMIFQSKNGSIYGFWYSSGVINYAQFNKETLRFSNSKQIRVNNLPKNPWLSYFNVFELKDGKIMFVFTIREDGVFDGPLRGKDVKPYTPEGFWPFNLPRVGIYGALATNLDASEITVKGLTSLNETLYAFEGYSIYEDQETTYLLASSMLGNFYAYKLSEAYGVLGERNYLVDPKHNMLRNPAFHAFSSYFKGPDSKEGLIVSSEGGIYFYENMRKKDPIGNLVFADPVSVMQKNADLYGGSLVVPELVDWDGDGVLDLISGTSTGHIWFFKNNGTNMNPSFLSPQALKAGGYTIQIQPGYRGSIQGPVEAKWGYTSPTVTDWNNDGLPDILTSDGRGMFMIYINSGTKTSPKLEPEKSLYLMGMDMHGAWRIKPGVGMLDGRMAYVCLDKDDEFHLYWQIDDFNLEDGGKLQLKGGQHIRANYQSAGAIGRAKINLVDWDGDGVKDLLVGTPKWGSIPEPKKGVPFNLKENGAAVIFLRNVGTEREPKFDEPKIVKFKGSNILLGGHECAPTVGYLGSKDSLNLIVGNEQGQFIFYDRKDLSW